MEQWEKCSGGEKTFAKIVLLSVCDGARKVTPTVLLFQFGNSGWRRIPRRVGGG